MSVAESIIDRIHESPEWAYDLVGDKTLSMNVNRGNPACFGVLKGEYTGSGRPELLMKKGAFHGELTTAFPKVPKWSEHREVFDLAGRVWVFGSQPYCSFWMRWRETQQQWKWVQKLFSDLGLPIEMAKFQFAGMDDGDWLSKDEFLRGKVTG